MAGVQFDALADKQEELIRKMIDASVFIAPFASDAIDSLLDADKSLAALPAGYDDVGLFSSDGAKFGREVDVSKITSMGRTSPTRTDIKGDNTTLQFAMQETKKATIGLYTGQDMTAITPDPSTGEVVIDKPTRPKPRFYRALVLGVDEIDGDELYVGRFLPRAMVTDYDEQAFQSDDDEALLWGVTLEGHVDKVLGTAERWLFGGPAWFGMLAEMGF